MIMKKILVFSVGRSDFDRYFPIIKYLNSKKQVDLRILISRAHYTKKFGCTYLEIKNKGFKIFNNNKSNSFRDTKEFIIKNLGDDISFISKKIIHFKPDLFIVMGDRYEMLAGPCAAIPLNVPVIHFYGGAVTEGAIDELVRHSITKMSHFHMVALPLYKKRLLQMGEEEWRVKAIGIPEIKYLKKQKKYSKKKILKNIGLDLNLPTLLFTFHPVTLEYKKIRKQINSILSAISRTKFQCVFSYPNADYGHSLIIQKIRNFVGKSKKYKIIKNSTAERYANLMRHCVAMVGNSSSGIVEAASFKLPVVNIGTRQDGKFKPKNVINVNTNVKSIQKAIKFVLSKNFAKKIKNLKNPYEMNISSAKIGKIILSLKTNDQLLRKKFINLNI